MHPSKFIDELLPSLLPSFFPPSLIRWVFDGNWISCVAMQFDADSVTVLMPVSLIIFVQFSFSNAHLIMAYFIDQCSNSFDFSRGETGNGDGDGESFLTNSFPYGTLISFLLFPFKLQSRFQSAC